jgi:hypothetical protein
MHIKRDEIIRSLWLTGAAFNPRLGIDDSRPKPQTLLEQSGKQIRQISLRPAFEQCREVPVLDDEIKQEWKRQKGIARSPDRISPASQIRPGFAKKFEATVDSILQGISAFVSRVSAASGART